MTNLINPSQLEKCIEYSDDSEKLKQVVKDLSITAKLVGYDKYFPQDKEPRYIYQIVVKRRTRVKSISFRFGDSIVNSQEGIELELYPILSTIASEYSCPDKFEDFCTEYGYDFDSISAQRTFKALQKQSKKLKYMFDQEELQYFPH